MSLTDDALQNSGLEEPKFVLLESILLKTEIQSLKKENSYLKEQIAWFKKQFFGPKKEQLPGGAEQLYFPGFEPTQEEKAVEKEVQAHTRKVPKKGKGSDTLSIPKDLPVETVILDIPDEQKQVDGVPLKVIGQEVTRKLAFKPGQYYIKEWIRPQYALPEGEGVLSHDLPPTLIPRSKLDESLLAMIAVKKYGDHLPLYRVSEEMARDRIHASRQLLSSLMVQCGLLMDPLYQLMKRKVLASKVLFIDESPVDFQDNGNLSQGYMVTLAGGEEAPYQVYEFKESRKQAEVLSSLSEYQGIFHSDKYAGYENFSKREGVIWCPCFAHIRRKFIEATGEDEFRLTLLRKIRYLFLFERIAWNHSPEKRLWIRQEKEAPILDSIISMVKEKAVKANLMPKSKFHEAIFYTYGLIPYLSNYLKDPRARLDNNTAERALRPMAIGRKNWLFLGSADGGKAASVLYSLVQSCRKLKINPREYLEDVFRRLLDHPANRLEELLPDIWHQSRSPPK